MKKETILAVTLGVLMGIGVGAVILNKTTRTDKKPIQRANLEVANNSKAPRANDKNIVFEISSPENDATASDGTIQIKGKAPKDSLLVFQSPSSNKILKPDKDTFTVDFPLALGENVIDITLYPKGEVNAYQEKSIKVYYLTQ